MPIDAHQAAIYRHSALWYELVLMRSCVRFLTVCLLALGLGGCALGKAAGTLLELPFTLIKGLTKSLGGGTGLASRSGEIEPGPMAVDESVRARAVQSRGTYAGNLANPPSGPIAGPVVNR